MKITGILSILLIASMLRAQPENIQVPGGIVFDGEPYIVVDPHDPNIVTAAWMSGVLTDIVVGIRTSVSSDGGHSWHDQNVLPHFGKGWHSADVSMGYSKTGILYVCYIDYRQSPDSGGIYVARSTDHGSTWAAPVQAFDALEVPNKAAVDRPWMVIDNSGSASDGTIYICTKPAPWILPTKEAPNRPYFKRSTDGGATWSAIATLDGGTYPNGYILAAPMPAPAVISNGSFSVVYPSVQLLQPARYIFERSYDKGLSFEQHIVVEKYSAVIKGDTLTKLGYKLLADPNDSNRLSLIIPGDTLGDWDVFVSSSTDGGRNWATPVRVNDDAVGNGVVQDLVWGSYAPNGDLVVVWRDRRNATQTGYEVPSDIYYAISKDNGLTFGKNIRLSSESAQHIQALNGAGNDFQCSAIAGDSLCVIWGDSRNGKVQIFFAKASLETGNSSVWELPQSDQEIAVYPTVVKNMCTVALEGNYPKVEGRLVSTTGTVFPVSLTKIENGEVSSFSAKFSSELPAGAYVLELHASEKMFRQKIVVVH